MTIAGATDGSWRPSLRWSGRTCSAVTGTQAALFQAAARPVRFAMSSFRASRPAAFQFLVRPNFHNARLACLIHEETFRPATPHPRL